MPASPKQKEKKKLEAFPPKPFKVFFFTRVQSRSREAPERPPGGHGARTPTAWCTAWQTPLELQALPADSEHRQKHKMIFKQHHREAA